MTTTGLKDYDFANKEKWRVWTWNQIRRKLKVPIKDAVGLYFPGPQDLDRPVAIKKGFSPHNLFGVERDCATVKALRKNKVNVIEGDLMATIRYWSTTPPQLDFINADFTCGITPATLAFLAALYGCDGMTNPTVVVVNLLRGRDKQLNDLTDAAFARRTVGNKVLKCIFPKKEQSKIHRGKKYAISGLLWMATHRKCVMIHHKKHGWDKALTHMTIEYMKSLKLSFYSYKSPKGRCYMDSCAFVASKTEFYHNSKVFGEIAERMEVNRKIISGCENLKTKVAAAKAIRTMRIEGTLPS
jgi:hypothetical protein